MNHPEWLRTDTVMARAEWDGREETPHELAARVAAQLGAADAALGAVGPWQVLDSDEAVMADDVEGFESIVAAHVDRDDDGVERPRRGYWFSLKRSGPNGTLSFRYRVGASIHGRRLPANAVGATAFGPVQNDARKAMSSEFISAVLRATVSAWDPQSAGVYDLDGTRALDDVGKFAPVMGQRTWVSGRLGDVVTATSGVVTTAGDGGWYLSADDELDSKTAVSEVRSTLEANGIIEIPRAAG